MKEKNKKLKEIILYIYDVSKVCGWWWVIVVLYDVCVMMHEAKEGCQKKVVHKPNSFAALLLTWLASCSRVSEAA